VTTAPFLSRPLGNFLLIAQLSEDALGAVYRAIYAPDERRFVRLRILQSPEISPEAVFSAIEKRAGDAAALVHRAIVPNAEVGLADDVPYFSWDEVAGWTLDQLLDRVRALDVRIPPEYALLVAERIASALEFAHRAVPGRPILHGLVWPGFVSISSNAEIRLGGFGLAEALLNSVHRTRIGREVAPYASPEARESGEVRPDDDVYSLGVLLTELLTGRRPRRSNPADALHDGLPVPEELRALLLRALAPSGERFASIVDMHRAVQELLTASPYALYTGNLALFLYRLLNPEGQNAVDASEGDSTNPIDVEAASTDEDDPVLPPFEVAAPVVAGSFPKERSDPRFQAILIPEPMAAPMPVPAPPNTVWIGRIGFAVAASLLAAGVFFPKHQAPAAQGAGVRAPVLAAPVFTVAAALSPAGTAQEQPAARRALRAPASSAVHASARKPRADRRTARERLAAAALARRSAESLRLRAALARVEAERLDSGVIARDLYLEAQGTENEGNRLVRQGAYEDAQPALMRATQLYRMAEDVSREERVRLVRLSSAQQ
jgi:serine/threonine protein kinase